MNVNAGRWAEGGASAVEVRSGGRGVTQWIGYVIEDNAFSLCCRFRGRPALPGARASSSCQIRARGSLRRTVRLRQRCARGRLPARPSKVVISHRGERRWRRETLPVRPLRALRALHGEISRACLFSPPGTWSTPGSLLSSSRSTLSAVQCPVPIRTPLPKGHGSLRRTARRSVKLASRVQFRVVSSPQHGPLMNVNAGRSAEGGASAVEVRSGGRRGYAGDWICC
jgi:hypothetical protein